MRDDNSIFVSLASYRDENCPATLVEMFSKADRPDYLFVGLVQQVRVRPSVRPSVRSFVFDTDDDDCDDNGR